MERTVALVQRKHVLVLDSLEATEPVQALWGMVTDAEVNLDGAKAELRKGGWTLAAEIRSPAEATFDVDSTAQPLRQAKNEGTRKLVVRLPEKVTKLALEVWLTPHRTGKPKPAVPSKPRL
jgi:hypothetical protein